MLVIFEIIKLNVVVLVLSCFEKYNVFNEEVISELICLIEYVNSCDVCVLVLKIEGKYFFVGVDLNWMKLMVGNDFVENLVDFMQLVKFMKVFVISFYFIICVV